MSYDISSYTNTRPVVVPTIPPVTVSSSSNANNNHNNKGGNSDSTSTTAISNNSMMSAAQQQQQKRMEEHKSAMERYHRYLQKQALLQQQVYQGIQDPLQPTNLQQMMITQQQNSPPASIQVVNNATATAVGNTVAPSSSVMPSATTTNTTISNNNDVIHDNNNDPNLSPSGIPEDEEPRRGSKIARVDFAGGITNGNNEEVPSSTTVWQSSSLGPSAATVPYFDTRNVFPPAHPATVVRPVPMNGGASSHSRVHHTGGGGGGARTITRTTTSHNNPNPDWNLPTKKKKTKKAYTSSFNPDVLVGVNGNTRLSQIQQQEEQQQQPTTADTILNRNASDSTGGSSNSTTAPNSFGKTPTLAMFYPSPARPATNTTAPTETFRTIANNNAAIAAATFTRPAAITTTTSTETAFRPIIGTNNHAVAPPAAAANTTITATPTFQLDQQQAFQQQLQQQLQQDQHHNATLPPKVPSQLLQVPATKRREHSPKGIVRKGENARFDGERPGSHNAGSGKRRSSSSPPLPQPTLQVAQSAPVGGKKLRFSDGGKRRSSSSPPLPQPPTLQVAQSAPVASGAVPLKSALRNPSGGGTAAGTGGTTTKTSSDNTFITRTKLGQSVMERKQEFQSKRPTPPPPPPEPKLTYWQAKQERLEEWWRKPPEFRPLKIVQAFCGVYIVVMSFTYVGTLGNVGGLVDPKSGFIIDPSSIENTKRGLILVNGDFRAVVARSNFQMISLAISRLSAFTMYPALVVVFFSKFRGTMNLVQSTYLGHLLFASDQHGLHVYCGHYILVDGCLHTIFHTARWAAQGNLDLLFKNPSGISGLIVIVSTLLICLPMMYGKRKVAYEIRKGFHYLFLIFALAMCFHVPTSGFPNGGFAPYVFGILLVWWFLDSLFVQWYLTEKIQSSRFYVLPSGVQLTMAVSERFQSWGTGGFCYVCLPWVNPYQWHAFSLFENPTEPHERQIFFQKLGNWTTQVHSLLGRETSRPVWVSGPFTSPYGNADNYDNQILVAGGIGITPALSVIRQLKDTRRCNLIWSTRDRHMLEFFIKHADLSHKGWNMVFYTGKEQLLGIEDVVVTGNGATIHIIRERPKLHFVIPNIIYGIESGTSMPEQFIPDDKIVAMELLQEKLVELEMDPELDSHEKLSELVNYCDELGYLFSDLISTLPNHDELTKAPTLASVSMENKSNRSVLDAILNFNSNDGSLSPSGGGDSGDRRNMLAKQRSAVASNRNMLYNASRRKLGGSGLRRRRVSLAPSVGNPRTARGNRESITTSTWGALAKSVNAVKAMKALGGLESLDEESSELDVEAGKTSSMFDQLELPFKPWDYNKEAEDFVKKMGEDELGTWGVLYCGGKSQLYRALKKAARKAKIEMHSESFSW